ncbi:MULTISPECIES: ABC transporter substrate-binding protein [unclassified Undibacterium]|uniref:ABC transporter substrate-binding protein n=1 Tax=unclassified Undibacterium TaxID=2630295 RepID=UPI002AC98C7D|nr:MULTISPECIES: ABC transporter substrate-binding protein [unclassified Undibacterium]MEB0137879.1 ABC transporter substrate-binding protein [Undibacterium sp. CCC2.1]MEB0174115.1 ABC transporter substrate-binding protein [Undibacterium sp. CCC1.1]MEB0174887.1 ABC transporter substrate-binding protein [Undibacterium sp. CCC3.4]MEB0214905.1 ABC transporter substrate-binding protein [Undibacterium sp. 5I2]WPX45337.1 ABC transporter substrate-binding protein [Undibacterium sp. CCC3.4]
MFKKILLVWLACAGAAQADETIRLGNLKFAHYGAVSYIKEIAPKCGIKVDERVFPKGLDAMQAVIAGELDIAAVSSEAVISARASGTPIFLVAGFARGGVRLVGRSDLGMKTVNDLKGKKVGVTRGGIQDILLAAELAGAGLTYSDQAGKDVQIIYLGFPDLNQALMGKNIDAMMQSEPYSSQSLSKGYGQEIIKPYDTPIGEPVRTMVMTEKFYKDHRPAAEKFMRCFVEATKLFIDNPALAEKYVRENMFKGQVSHEDFVNAIGNSPYTYDITAEHIQITTDLMQKYGVGKMLKPPLAKDWVKTDLLEQAKRSLNVK